MMKVNFKSTSVIKTRLGIQKYGPAHKFFAERCRQHMNARYVPEGTTKHLTQTSFVSNTCDIIYPQPYAHYQYIGKLYVDPVTKSSWARKGVKKIPTNVDLVHHKVGTGPYWDKKMVSAEMQDIEKEVQEYVKRGCNDEYRNR